MILLDATTTVGMSDDLKGVIITAVVTSLISIIGFILTNFSMRKSFKNELAMQRDTTALEKMSSIPYETLDFYDITIKTGKINKELNKYNKPNLNKQELIQKKKMEAEKKQSDDFILNKMNYLYNTIYAYGSPKSIQIVSKMQSLNYVLGENSNESEKMEVLACMILLATQVKKDVTTVVVNPKYWLRMRLTDYHTKHDEIDSAINRVVNELKLDKNFLIK